MTLLNEVNGAGMMDGWSGYFNLPDYLVRYDLEHTRGALSDVTGVVIQEKVSFWMIWRFEISAHDLSRLNKRKSQE